MDFSFFQWLIQSNQFVSNCILLYHLKLECSGFELFHLKQALQLKTDVREKKAKTIFYVNMQEIWFGYTNPIELHWKHHIPVEKMLFK